MPSDNTDGSAVKTGVKFSVVGLALIGALYFGLLRGSDAEGQPDGPDAASPYVCVECQKPFTVTPAEYDRMSKSGELKTVRTDENDRRGQLRLPCPNCGKLGGVEAFVCPKDATSFPGVYMNGKPPKCPKCGWTP